MGERAAVGILTRFLEQGPRGELLEDLGPTADGPAEAVLTKVHSSGLLCAAAAELALAEGACGADV